MKNKRTGYGQCKKKFCAWPLNKDKTCDKCTGKPKEHVKVDISKFKPEFL